MCHGKKDDRDLGQCLTKRVYKSVLPKYIPRYRSTSFLQNSVAPLSPKTSRPARARLPRRSGTRLRIKRPSWVSPRHRSKHLLLICIYCVGNCILLALLTNSRRWCGLTCAAAARIAFLSCLNAMLLPLVVPPDQTCISICAVRQLNFTRI